jgi:hypothetical protein
MAKIMGLKVIANPPPGAIPLYEQGNGVMEAECWIIESARNARPRLGDGNNYRCAVCKRVLGTGFERLRGYNWVLKCECGTFYAPVTDSDSN